MGLGYVPADGTSLPVTLNLHRVDTTSASVIYQLPPIADDANATYTFEKTDSGGNTITIKPSTGETIVGQATLVITTQYQTVRVYAPLSGTDWVIMTTTSQDDASTHAALTAAHGATGANVGTTNIQTFSVGAKTFASGILVATRPKITTSIDDSGGNEIIKTPATASAVNELTITNSATGDPVLIDATGGDSTVGITISPKSTAVVKVLNLAEQAKVTTISGDGAITIVSGIVALTKGSAAAITLAAPSSGQAGSRIQIVAGSAFAHVVTATGLIDDGVTGGSKNTATLGAFVGASVTLVAYNLKWVVECKTVCTIA